MENSKRKIEHRKNTELEKVLAELSNLLSNVDNNREFYPSYPIVFIMGCARSGTTLLMQYLASLSIFCYPTNLLSRFYYSPYIGSLVQKMLYDLDEKQELLKYYEHRIEYVSVLGKTRGILSPHEFWYYWRRFFNFGEIQKLTAEEIDKADWNEFLRGLYAIQQVNNRPLLMKGMIMNWHIPELAEKIPQAYFVHIKRDIAFNAQSLLDTRLKFFGSLDEWYSFKPPEFWQIKDKPHVDQVVDQVYFTNQAIEKGLKGLDEKRYLQINYEELCRHPQRMVKKILQMLGIFSIELGNENFSDSGKIMKAKDKKWQEIQAYAKKYL